MTTQKIYTVRDTKAEAFLQPFYVRSRGEAIRSFSDALKDSRSMLGQHPEDFYLFELGEWDECTAGFVLHPAPVSLGGALEYVALPNAANENASDNVVALTRE